MPNANHRKEIPMKLRLAALSALTVAGATMAQGGREISGPRKP